MSRTPHATVLKDRVIALVEDGTTVRMAAELSGVPKTTVQKWVQASRAPSKVIDAARVAGPCYRRGYVFPGAR
jgi:transposase